MKKHIIKILEKHYYFKLFVNNNFAVWFSPKVKINSILDTLNAIEKDKKSISRFGDGEFNLLFNHNDLGFQEINKKLASRLKEVLTSNLENHIIALPPFFSELRSYIKPTRRFWRKTMLVYRKLILELVDIEAIYGNAFISRFYFDFNDKQQSVVVLNKWKQLWDNKDILIVEGEYSRLGNGNDLFSNSNSINRILCPATNAFSKYEQIFQTIETHAKDKLVLIALGPTATVLAFDLAKINIWAVDVGHIDIEYSWMLARVNTKVAIKGKYVNEVENSFEEAIEIDLNVYNESIIAKINI